MKVTTLSSNACQVTVLGAFNAYLVRENDGFTLIDTTLGGKAKDLIAAAQECSGQIRRILLTHAHSDHIGSLDQVRALLGKVDLAISEREAPMLHKDLSLRPGEPQQKPKGGFPGATSRPTHTLTEGELYGSLRCIATPGHTPGHMSFLDERDGTLYAGDALVTIGKRLNLVTSPPWWFPFPKAATWDKPLATRSAKKLLQYQPQTICAGHGAVLQGGTEALRALLEREGVH